MADAQPGRTPPDLACLVQHLLDLRDALLVAALALSDYQCALDSEQSRAAQQQMLHLIDRAKARDYSPGDGL